MSDSEKLKKLRQWHEYHIKSAVWYKKKITSLENDIKTTLESNKKLSLRTIV